MVSADQFIFFSAALEPNCAPKNATPATSNFRDDLGVPSRSYSGLLLCAAAPKPSMKAGMVRLQSAVMTPPITGVLGQVSAPVPSPAP